MYEFMDFEASSLDKDHSYPIQVGWTNGCTYKSLYIKPLSMWQDWCDDAEFKIHKISKGHLLEKGTYPDEVMIILNKELKDKTLYTEAFEMDNFWFSRLIEAADIQPTFQLQSLSSLSNKLYFDYDLFWHLRKKLIDPNLAHDAAYDAYINKKALFAALDPINFKNNKNNKNRKYK